MLNQCILVGKLKGITKHINDTITILLSIEDNENTTLIEVDVPKYIADITEMIDKESLIAIKGKLIKEDTLKVLAERMSYLKRNEADL